jgi:hypothetical protein
VLLNSNDCGVFNKLRILFNVGSDEIVVVLVPDGKENEDDEDEDRRSSWSAKS